MKRTTLRTLLVLTVLFDIAVLGLLLYDYLENNSDWEIYVLVAFAVFLLIAIILFLLKPSDEAKATVVKEVVVEKAAEPAPVQFQEVRPIPPAPLYAPPPRTIVAPPRPASSGIPFVFNGYTLYHKVVQLKNEGGKRTIYFFAKKKPKSGSMCAKPLGYHVGVNERTGLPFLKRGAGKDGEDLTPVKEKAYRPQCAALTGDGKQCRNSAREGSKYCGSHVGYQPPVLSKAKVSGKDVKPRVGKAKDTKPSTRKSWFGRVGRRNSA